MAFDKTPTTWIPNWSEDGTSITVPIATFSEMTADEAHASNGDIRKILFAICEQIQAKWYSVAAADRPSKMTISKSTYTNVNTGVVTNTYTFRFDCGITGQEVVAES